MSKSEPTRQRQGVHKYRRSLCASNRFRIVCRTGPGCSRVGKCGEGVATGMKRDTTSPYPIPENCDDKRGMNIMRRGAPGVRNIIKATGKKA
jgi:hypothetical protein